MSRSSVAVAAPAPGNLVEGHDLGLSMAGREILSGVDIRVARGEIVTLIGLNGSGKSTLVKVVVGLLKPDRGGMRRAGGLRIGYVPQQVHRDPVLPMTVFRFLRMGADLPRVAMQDQLAEVGLEDLLDQPLISLSGGEYSRVLLARALLREPDLLVLDEPLAGVDLSGQSELYQLIADIRDRRNCGVLLVSHDLHVVMAATDHVVCLNHHVCCTGHPESVRQHPEFISLFGQHVADTLAVYTHHHDHRHDAAGHTLPLDDGEQS